jgi:hypothetical protein
MNERRAAACKRSRARASAGVRLARVCTHGALWRECWHRPVPMCAACWESSRQVAVKYRAGLVVIDATRSPAAPQASGGAGLDAHLHCTRGVLDITAALQQPGSEACGWAGSWQGLP